MFLDRAAAGKKLAVTLSDLQAGPDALVVLAIPRGGVLVAPIKSARPAIPNWRSAQWPTMARRCSIKI